ncbi:hypothetical protein [Haloimpatiens lingqiaonensis]|uniref:hypothetical protein n=1 Tax=Haloimpatiens lingqiaonensis TaxID=1380675 RepID=UPI0010FF13FB|nr:hypothetical protein [Haloimpatiens lingqiaonensis]
MKRINGKKIILFIIAIFAALNISWFLITTIKYNKFVKAVPKNEYGFYAMTKEDGYTYSVKKPDYLHYTGNLAVTNNKNNDLLIIWPRITGGYEYGLILQENEGGYNIYVDKNMKPIDINKDDPHAIEMIEEHKVGVEALISRANKMWRLKE